MQFTTFALSALSIGSALAQAGVTVHVVRVGSMNGSLAYYPNNIKAAVGDMVQFQFAPNNHTVTQSTFDAPCQPIAANSNVTGIYSGFMPVSASSTTTPTYTIMVKAATPMWLYCSQGKHCQNGMTMVINENTAANSSRSLSAYQALAAKSTVNLPGVAVGGGSSNTTAGTGTGTGTESGSGTGSGTSPSGTASGTSAPQATTSGSAAHHVRAGDAMGLGGLFAVALALFL
ncbi:Cupredoxin [Rhexocercosporidium sp. MPI-PUGE-AT-0058]|nr:Cupredoxin [Rhexocercosporidium sp. MPI-PUGE-AT-0058]